MAFRFDRGLTMEKRQIQGVLFDMDGLVLDTEKLYCRFWMEAAKVCGYPMTMEQALGMRSLNREAGEAKLKSYFGEGVSYAKVRKKRMELMDAFIEKAGIEKKPGIDVLLDFLQRNGIKTAIATSSPIERTVNYLSVTGLKERFDALVSGYMVEHGKPEPDIYLYAARQLHLEPKHCLVLEDSPAGILAAYRAGCMPVMVPDLDLPDENTEAMLYAKAESLKKVIDIIKSQNK